LKRVLLSSILFISVSLSQDITVFGGLNESAANWNEDQDFGDFEEGYASGLKIGIEKRVGPALLGLGFNQRGLQINIDSDGIEGFRKGLINYVTFHGLYPINLKDGITGFGGLQLGQPMGSVIYAEETYDGETATNEEEFDAETFNFDYGIIFGAQYWLTEKIGLRTSYYLGLADVEAEVEEEYNYKNTTVSFSLIYGFGESGRKSSSGSGPSAKVDKKKKKGGAPKRPSPLNNAEIDNFVNAAFDLNDQIIALKEKLEKVSEGLKESNAILSDIGNHPNGALGWASDEVKKGTSKSVNNAKSKSISNADALNPTQHLRKKLQTLKSGVVDGGKQLASVPDDLKAIGEKSKSLISSAKELPKAAKSLGMKAPKALKNIKNTTDILTKIPTEVTSIGSETKKVLDEIKTVLENIDGILSSK
jgi:methyl-accepting chemotaxis protein